MPDGNTPTLHVEMDRLYKHGPCKGEQVQRGSPPAAHSQRGVDQVVCPSRKQAIGWAGPNWTACWQVSPPRAPCTPRRIGNSTGRGRAGRWRAAPCCKKKELDKCWRGGIVPAIHPA
jgi:hypothetical protein